MTAPIGLSQCLSVRDGRIHLDVPDGILPGFLIEAFNATICRDLERARRLSTPLHWALVDRMAAEGLPGASLASVVLAMVLQRTGQCDAAIHRYEVIAAGDPHPLVLNELAEMCRDQGLPSRALGYREQALRQSANDPGLQANYALDLICTGRIQEGIALFQGLVDRGQASASAHSCLLFYLHYLPEVDRRALFEEHRRWGLHHAPMDWARQDHPNDPDPDRPLRIGYLSADFRSHCVAYTFEAALDRRDRQAFEVFGYGSVASPDAVTSRLASKFDAYRSVWGIDDRGVADRIGQDRIDILVALAGHSAGHRLRVLAYKPAPIQVDSGGLSTTGMAQVDYRLTDRWLDPPEVQPYYLEGLVYLPGGYGCYRPVEDAPAVASLPALRKGYVTFGSFNSHLKMNALTVSLWAQVLRVCPGSRMVIRCRAAADDLIRDLVWRWFRDGGIGADRIDLVGWQPDSEYMALYHEVDVALDTYPYNGAITTLEGLWMGVPVISLAGPSFVSREGLALLSALDMGAFCASTPEQYVAKARALSENLQALARLRASLRSRMQTSSLCDARRFAREVETAYRQMWRRWCDNQIKNQKSKIKNEELKTRSNSTFRTQHSELLSQGGDGR